MSQPDHRPNLDVPTDATSVVVEQLSGVEPLDFQMGVSEPRTIPCELSSLMFDEQGFTTALIDANRMSGLVERIEAEGCHSECLFDRSDTTDQTAPWLVAINRKSSLLRELFTAAPDGRRTAGALWHSDAAIYLQSSCTLSQLRSHLRRFIRVLDPSGKAFYFRFWEPHAVPAYFRSLAGRPEDIVRWFKPRDGGTINRIIAPDVVNETVYLVEPVGLPEQASPPRGRFDLERSDIEAMAKARTDRQLGRLAKSLSRAFPDQSRDFDTFELTRTVATRLHPLGIRRLENIFVILAWTLHHGEIWDERDEAGRLSEILHSNKDEPEKVMALKARMAELGDA